MHCCLDCGLERHVELDAGPNGLSKAVYRIVFVRGNVSCCQHALFSMLCWKISIRWDSQSYTQAMLVAVNAVDRALYVPEQCMHMHPVIDVCGRSSADCWFFSKCIVMHNCHSSLPYPAPVWPRRNTFDWIHSTWGKKKTKSKRTSRRKATCRAKIRLGEDIFQLLYNQVTQRHCLWCTQWLFNNNWSKLCNLLTVLLDY